MKSWRLFSCIIFLEYQKEKIVIMSWKLAINEIILIRREDEKEKKIRKCINSKKKREVWRGAEDRRSGAFGAKDLRNSAFITATIT